LYDLVVFILGKDHPNIVRGIEVGMDTDDRLARDGPPTDLRLGLVGTGELFERGPSAAFQELQAVRE
jgi:hypothetical protein